jgi:ribosomal-protein-alanine N-acetyltransferase
VNFLELKPLTADLLAEVVELDRRCLGGLWSLEGYRREIDSPNSDLLVLQQNTPGYPPVLIGLACLWAIAEEAHITVLAVDPAYQRQGLGQLMLYVMLSFADQRGLEWATLEVRVSNVAAINLYQKFGFSEVGHRKRYYQDTGEDALILWRSGIQKPEFREFMQNWRQKLKERLERSNSQIRLPVWLSWDRDSSISTFPLDLEAHFS